MSLTGSHNRNLDEKNRLAVPKRFRDLLSPGRTEVVVAPGTETSISLYSLETFEQIGQKLAEKSTNKKESRAYLRVFYSQAEHVSLDSQGRIRIPERLVTFAQLSSQEEVTLIGVHDHCEIWNRNLWEKFLAENSQDFDEMATQAFE